jgi:hypothetical protein
MAKAKNSTVRSELPKGYKNITGGNAWRPEKAGQHIQGKYAGSKSIDLPKKGKQPARSLNIHRIDTSDGQVEVMQSAGLKALEGLKKGTSVYIQYVGLKKLGGGRNPMREFIVGTK